MAKRRSQINFETSDSVKAIYNAMKARGPLNPTKLCAAGFVLLLEHPALISEAIKRLSWHESSPDAPRDSDAIEAYIDRLRIQIRAEGVDSATEFLDAAEALHWRTRELRQAPPGQDEQLPPPSRRRRKSS